MNYYRNASGKADPTAGAALDNIAREERMKKRSCRRTKDESFIHEKAVSMRKMTDEQLYYYVEDRVKKARSEGYNQGKEEGLKLAQHPEYDWDEMENKILLVRGVGVAKADAIMGIIRGIIENDG